MPHLKKKMVIQSVVFSVSMLFLCEIIYKYSVSVEHVRTVDLCYVNPVTKRVK